MKLYRFLLTTTLGMLIPCLSYADYDHQMIVAKALDTYELHQDGSITVSSTQAPAAPIQLASVASTVSPTATITSEPPTTQSASPAPEPTPAAATSAPAAPAEEETNTLFGDLLKKYNIAPSGSVTLDYYSRYVWRGQYLDRDGVFQPGITVSANGFSVGYWSNWDMVGNDALSSNESDYFLSYSYTFESLTLSAGHTWYQFPGTGTSSMEYFISAGLSNLPFSPVFTFYHDYQDGKDLGQGHGNYYSLYLSRTWDVYKKYGISMTLGGTVGYIDHQWLNGKGYHFTPTLALNIPITKSLTISPTIGYNFTGGDLHDGEIGNQENSAFGGVHSAVAF